MSLKLIEFILKEKYKQIEQRKLLNTLSILFQNDNNNIEDEIKRERRNDKRNGKK
jgi:hypothetical protein